MGQFTEVLAMEYAAHREMQIIDANATYFGVPREVLMENAGRACAEELEKRLTLKGKKIAVFCGAGNNGGDGFAAARYLTKKGAKVQVFFTGKPRSRESKKNFELIKKDKKIKLAQLDLPEKIRALKLQADIIIDALLGTGVKGEIQEPIRSIVEKINGSSAFKLSVDLPSGLRENGEGLCVAADVVVTFHKAKKGLEKFSTVVASIGIPKEAETCVGAGDVAFNVWQRSPGSHKGDNGRVLVVGGSAVYHGAPLLSAKAALNGGADMAYLAVPEINYVTSRNFAPDFIVRKYRGDFLSPEAVPAILELMRKCDALVIGPGLGEAADVRQAVLEILASTTIPAVIDADAIKFVASDVSILKKVNAVVTPHAGEFKTLTGEALPEGIEERRASVAKHAQQLGATILLKSPIDIIASPRGSVKLNATGNAGMTVGGTGDVLAGLVASLAAQKLDSFTAASCAAFINGAAGDELYEGKGYGFTASDLAEQLPHTIKKIIDLKERYPRRK